MRTSRTLPRLVRPGPVRPVVLALLVVLISTGCAPLEPESKKAEGRSTPSASPSAPPSSPTTSPTPRSTERPVRPKPTIKVPKFKVPSRYRGLVEGGDVSWPQCPKGMGIPQKPTLGLPMPLPSAKFVILGLTNGPAFTPNPCLASQVQWVKSRRLLAAAYAVNSYPDDQTLARYGQEGPFDGGSKLGALSNVGFQQAKFNLATMKRAGLQTPIVWLDVEPVPIFVWSTDTTANAAVVRGAARGYADAGYRIGAYSTQALWATVVGDLRLGIPEWRAAGQTSRAEALRRCGADRMFQGGEPVLSQWVADNRDLNVTCPGTSAEMLRWFHQY